MIRELLHSDGTVTMLPAAEDGRGDTPSSGAAGADQVARCTRIEPREIAAIMKAPGNKDILWLDIEDPTEADLALLRDEFHLHLLAIEDIRTRNQRPKVDDYGTFAHVVIYAAERTKPSGLVVQE